MPGIQPIFHQRALDLAHDRNRTGCLMPLTDDPDIGLHYRSPALDGSIGHVVTVPTFRRPDQLRETLASIVAQRFDRPFAIVVMENDAEGMEGAHAAEAFLTENRFPGLVVIARQRGNCHAYNAGWKATLQTFDSLEAIAVIDDDEVADPDWLENLVHARERFGVDMVGAPQIPIFEQKTSERWARHPVFTPAYAETGRVPILYSSGNVPDRPDRCWMPCRNRFWIRCSTSSAAVTRISTAGRAKTAFASPGATRRRCFETIPDRRTERSWLRARSQREGAISAIIEKRARPNPAGRLRILAKSLAMLALSPLRSVRLWARTGSPVIGLYFVDVAIGRFIAEFGQINEQYRNPESN